MTSIPKKIYSMIIVFILTLVPGIYPKSVYAGELQEHTIRDRETSSLVSLRIDNGLLNARIENATLKQVLEELRRQALVEFTFLDPDLGYQTINADIQYKPPKHALKTILAGYSYFLSHKKGLSSIYILSTPGMSYSRRYNNAIESRNIEKVWKARNYEDNSWNSAEESSHRNFEQALRLVEEGPSEHYGDHNEALEQLVGQDDERATQALIDTALLSDDSGLGADAADALARHAAEFEYRDQEVISALQTLAHKNQRAIKETAQQALQEMEKFNQLPQ